ncbi:PREDICTED: uncharacterized protein LOC104597639 [Nelumbo nucifera]|uniref:Uncharacterized protein n=2 Tax=Nelumbo nucifera TaxID=4432 RepID=A0A822ZK57_NELNU|nr:PREDICTED: uncharacterized protein LOC104597639 [Nelumbo nucifera]DAD42118.1 TPA_asm: hypothetical protein HUJ06_000348 [Nelumbo nucifera]
MAQLVITNNSSQMLHLMKPNNQQIKTAAGRGIGTWKPRNRSPPSQINVVLKAAAFKKWSMISPANSTNRRSNMTVPEQPESIISYLQAADVLLKVEASPPPVDKGSGSQTNRNNPTVRPKELSTKENDKVNKELKDKTKQEN